MARNSIRLLVVSALLAATSPAFPITSAQAQQSTKLFSLPFATPPGPGTWLLGQPYGNTSGAARLGKYWYAAGQGLHFGIDFSAPCGTPVTAIADGVVEAVDNFSFGLEPHNLVLSHRAIGYTSLYGHLFSTPTLLRGQIVRRGDVVGLSGDPDRTCVSRPHLHLEVRDMNYSTAYDPVPLLDADWPMLATVGNFGAGLFAKDLSDPNHWQTLENQPDVKFGGNVLNNYANVWPLPQRVQPPPETLPVFTALPIAASVTAQKLTQPGCCSQAWWSPDGRTLRFWDGAPGQRAVTRVVSIDGSAPALENAGLYRLLSPNGQYAVQWDSSRAALVLYGLDGKDVPLSTGGAWPRFSPGSQRLLWQYLAGEPIPGSSNPLGEIWVANLDGSGKIRVAATQGASVRWLDDGRVLISRRVPNQNVFELSIFNVADKSTTPLLTATNLRGLSAAPGGKYLVYYLAFQQDASLNGMYLLETRARATPKKLPFFGSWRWRDRNSLLYIPYLPGHPMSLVEYDILKNSQTPLMGPAMQNFNVANDDWSISPDGRNLAFWKAGEYAIWTMKLMGNSKSSEIIGGMAPEQLS